MSTVDWQTIQELANANRNNELTPSSLIMGSEFGAKFNGKIRHEALVDDLDLTADELAIFDDVGTKDIDIALRHIDHAIALKTYIDDNSIKTLLEISNGVRNKLKKHLFEINRTVFVGNVIDRGFSDLVCKLLENFRTIHYLGYDLALPYCLYRYKSKETFYDLFEQDSDGNMSLPEEHEIKAEFLFKTRGKSTLLYPNGNMILGAMESQFGPVEKKLSLNTNQDMLVQISEMWRDGFNPLLVSEATYSEKLRAVDESHYLSEVHKKYLCRMKGFVVLLYCSLELGQNDHIYRTLLNHEVDSVAISYSDSLKKTRYNFNEMLLSIANSPKFYMSKEDRKHAKARAERLISKAAYFHENEVVDIPENPFNEAA